MNDSTHPHPAPEPPPFGAGVPAEAVEPVRLPPGLAHGPALDVRGGAVTPAPETRNVVASTPPPSSLAAAAMSARAAAVGATQSAPNASPSSPAPTSPTFASAPPTAAPSDPSASATSSASSAPPPPPHAGFAPPPSPPPYVAPSAKPPRRWWVGLAHLFFLIPFPFGVSATAVLWIWRRARDPLMADQGREAINMQLTFWLLIGLLGVSCLGHPLVPFAYVVGAVLCVLAAISAGGGERHRYPWVFRFIA